MKKKYLSALALLSSAFLSAQTFTWDATSYKGAFPYYDGISGVTSNDWSAGWTNWDPENTIYPVATMTISGSITSQTWSPSNTYLLSGTVAVAPGNTLTILPGTVIRGDKASKACLIITAGAKINAVGTVANPIIFTSNEEPSVNGRAAADWGGVVLLGNGIINTACATCPAGVKTNYIEGFASNFPEILYGGNDNTESSGTMSYCRIEFAGVALSTTPNSELNSLTMGGVGSGTKIDHIQTSFGGDDSFEWFGGAVDAKHLISFRCVDDDFDTDFGYTGRVQYGLIVRDKDASDAAGDSNGFESDNFNPGIGRLPITKAEFRNITSIGPKRDGTVALPGGEKFERAIFTRRNTAISIKNSIMIGWEKGWHLSGSTTFDNYNANVNLDSLGVLENTIIASDIFPHFVFDAGGANGAWYNTYAGAHMIDTVTTVAQLHFVNAFPTNLSDMPDFRQISQSFQWDATSYKGAFPNYDGLTGVTSNDWSAGWTNWDPENTVYPATNITISGSITSQTWSPSNTYLLSGTVAVAPGNTLTILPGTVIRGDKASKACLIITAGAKIYAVGTKTNPIVFTSNEEPSVNGRASADWGGVVLLGNGVINTACATCPAGVKTNYIEGFASNFPEILYGGNDNTESSGTMSYCRIEFAGVALSTTPNSELNSLTMGGVGSGTKIDHIQASFGGDDSFEWFGGAVDAKYLISFRGIDDDFDTDFGYLGRVQYGLIVRDKDASDAAGDSNGFESDNFNPGIGRLPITKAEFRNITSIGPKRDGTVALPAGEKFERAIFTRRNTAISIKNSIMVGWEKGWHLSGSTTFDNYNANVNLDSLGVIENTIITSDVFPHFVFDAGGANGAWYNTYAGTNMIDTVTTIAQLKFVNAFPTNLSDVPDFRQNPLSVGINKIAKMDKQAFAIYPNPTSQYTNIAFNLSDKNLVSVYVYDVLGNLVSTPYNNNEFEQGNNVITLNTSNFSAGIYYVSLEMNGIKSTKKLIVNN